MKIYIIEHQRPHEARGDQQPLKPNYVSINRYSSEHLQHCISHTYIHTLSTLSIFLCL